MRQAKHYAMISKVCFGKFLITAGISAQYQNDIQVVTL
ncbi:hypothetical protein CHK_2693 [Christensenella hongkongensis]|uniref:Uncharacterized protein n=1 Tax=Christensenella hongkongensis TaxID=270498 RepID=A0A0M2NHY3_9FIRM|nr:hypothetical protein CHK_2693 [Christensenella hongkongensis]